MTTVTQQRILSAFGQLSQDARETGVNCWTARRVSKTAAVGSLTTLDALASLREMNLVARTAADTREPLYRLTQAGRIEVTRMSDCPGTCGAVAVGKHERWCVVEMAKTYAKFLAQYSAHTCTDTCDHQADVRRQLALVCRCGTPCHSDAELEEHRVRHGGKA